MRQTGRLAYISLLLIAMLSLSMYVMPQQQAQALSAVIFTSKASPTSIATTNWQRVYENGTSNVIFLDGNVNGTYNKKSYIIGDTTFTSSNSPAITGTGANILTSPTGSAASSTDLGGVVWYSSTSTVGDTFLIIEQDGAYGDHDGIAQKVSSVSSPLYNRPVNFAAFFISKNNDPIEDPTTGVYNAPNGGGTVTELFTFGEIESTDVGTSRTQIWTNATSTTYFKLTSTDHAIGIDAGNVDSAGADYYEVWHHTSNQISNTYETRYACGVVGSCASPQNAWADATTSDLQGIFGFNPHLTHIDDGDVDSFWRNNVNSEAGAYVCVDQASAKLTTGVRIYFPEATEIPQTLDVLVGSACNTGTDVGDWSTTGAVGYDSFTFSAISGRYVTVKVNTWGSDVRMRVGEFQTYAAGAINSTPLTSFIETNSTLFVAGRDTINAGIGVAKFNLGSNTQLASYFTGSTKSVKDVAQSSTNVYVALVDGSNNLYLGIANRALNSYSEVSLGDAMLAGGFVHMAVYDGSPDTIYVVYSDSTTVVKVAKYTSTASILGTGMTQSSNADFQAVQLSGKVVIHTNSRLYELVTSTDTITQVYGSAMLTKYPQVFNVTGGVKTYHTAVLYAADSIYATQYVPNTGASSQAAILISTVTPGTSSMTTYAPAKYYLLSKNGYVVDAATAAATTWTIKQLGTRIEIDTTAWQEELNIDLILDESLYLDSVLKIVCDANYPFNSAAFEKFAVGNDSDCTSYTILATSAATVGRRILNYSTEADLVHADAYTAYTFQLSGGNPSDYPDYRVQTLYDDKYVDEVDMDSQGSGQQRWLYGQCYTVKLINGTTGSLFGAFDPICANDFFTKTLNLGGGGSSEGNGTGLGFVPPLVVPPNFIGSVWSHVPIRNFTTSEVFYYIDNQERPFDIYLNATIKTPGQADVELSTSFIGQTEQAVWPISNVPTNATVYLVGYDVNDITQFSDIVAGRQASLSNPFEALGPLLGHTIPIIILIILGLLFIPTTAHWGIIIVAAAYGIMVAMGLISFDLLGTAGNAAFMAVVIVGVLAWKRYG